MSKGLASVKTLTAKQIADKWKLPLAVVAKKIAAGVTVEKEHTTSLKQANEIARDHLGERPDYYDKLDKMEKTKVVKEMDMSGFPLSKNIDDRRTPERKADDAKIKPGEDIGGPSGDGPSYSWMKSPRDWGSPTKPNHGYETGPYDLKAPEQKQPFRNDADSLTPHQQLDKSYWSEPVKAVINKPRLKISEESATGAVRGLGFVTGDPGVNPVTQYINTNAMAYVDENGNKLEYLKKQHNDLHNSQLGFKAFDPTRIGAAKNFIKEARLNELGEYEDKNGMPGYEGTTGPIRAVRKRDVKEQSPANPSYKERPMYERSTGKVPSDMSDATARGIYEISANTVGAVSNARFWRGEPASKTLNRAIIKKFIESGNKKEPNPVKEEDNTKPDVNLMGNQKPDAYGYGAKGTTKTIHEETKMDNKELINEALDCILEDNLSEMKDNLMLALQEKAMEKLEERKKEIAANYFAQ